MSQNEWNMRDEEPTRGDYWQSKTPAIDVVGPQDGDARQGGTFNYGRALGAPKRVSRLNVAAWLDDSPAAEYENAEKTARDIGALATRLSDASWALQMALRNVRHATNEAEQAEAMKELRATLARVDSDTEAGLKTDTVKLYRFGRIGTIHTGSK